MRKKGEGAMADVPSRALVIYGDGLLPHIAEHHCNLHALASEGCCGFLALRSHPSTVTEEERISAELIQLLDLHDVYKDNCSFQSMSERFMGMKAAMLTNSQTAGAIGIQAGFSVNFFQEYQQDEHNHNDEAFPDPKFMASNLLNLVGLGEPDGTTSELLLVHIVAKDEHDASAAKATAWIDSVVGKLKELARPGTKAASHLYLVLVLGYGAVPDERKFEESWPNHPELLHLRPVQSFSMKAGKPLDSIRDHHPLLAVYHQNAVTRRDNCGSFTIEEFYKNCGNLTILADRFLHEVAFKLWKAPKYGA